MKFAYVLLIALMVFVNAIEEPTLEAQLKSENAKCYADTTPATSHIRYKTPEKRSKYTNSTFIYDDQAIKRHNALSQSSNGQLYLYKCGHYYSACGGSRNDKTYNYTFKGKKGYLPDSVVFNHTHYTEPTCALGTRTYSLEYEYNLEWYTSSNVGANLKYPGMFITFHVDPLHLGIICMGMDTFIKGERTEFFEWTNCVDLWGNLFFAPIVMDLRPPIVLDIGYVDNDVYIYTYDDVVFLSRQNLNGCISVPNYICGTWKVYDHSVVGWDKEHHIEFKGPRFSRPAEWTDIYDFNYVPEEPIFTVFLWGYAYPRADANVYMAQLVRYCMGSTFMFYVSPRSLGIDCGDQFPIDEPIYLYHYYCLHKGEDILKWFETQINLQVYYEINVEGDFGNVDSAEHGRFLIQRVGEQGCTN